MLREAAHRRPPLVEELRRLSELPVQLLHLHLQIRSTCLRHHRSGRRPHHLWLFFFITCDCLHHLRQFFRITCDSRILSLSTPIVRLMLMRFMMSMQMMVLLLVLHTMNYEPAGPRFAANVEWVRFC